MKLPLSTFSFTVSFFIFFSGCTLPHNKQTLSPEDQAAYISKGKSIVQQSFQVLSGELQAALQEGGVQNAAAYCHLQASPIIDSLNQVYQVGISRVTDRFRNHGNQAQELDLTVMEGYRQQIKDGRELQPHLEVSEGEIIYYAPIVIQNPMCLLCHGDPGKTIQDPDYDFIHSKYPEDMAVGYQLGDLRGLWKIRFEQQQP